MSSYRQFGLLAGSSKVFTRADYGTTQVDEKKESLMKAKKLVLVLDLDNTLLHANEFPLSLKQKKNPHFRTPNLHCIDSNRYIYHIWTHQFSYQIKLRPFLHSFLTQCMDNYDLYFYTAATRSYGELCVKLLKLEMAK
jgi:TFIIF-interacting CTD phosphatase-like protein